MLVRYKQNFEKEAQAPKLGLAGIAFMPSKKKQTSSIDKIS